MSDTNKNLDELCGEIIGIAWDEHDLFLACTLIKPKIQEYSDQTTQSLQKENEEMKQKKLVFQLFIGKVSDVIGFDKTTELLRESHDAFNPSE